MILALILAFVSVASAAHADCSGDNKSFTMMMKDDRQGCKKGKAVKKNGKVCTEKRPCSKVWCEEQCAAQEKCMWFLSDGIKCVLHTQGCLIGKRPTKWKITKGDTYAASCVDEPMIGVSWANMQEARWAVDKQAIEDAVTGAGATIVHLDADNSHEQQKLDIEALSAMDIDALIVVAVDSASLVQDDAFLTAKGRQIPVMAYDRLIKDDDIFYITFNNVEVGEYQAQAVFNAQPTGNYVFVKGSQADPNADFVHEGQLNVLQTPIANNAITVIGETYIQGWKPSRAKTYISNLIDGLSPSDYPDAIVCSNDGMATAIIEVLTEKGLNIPVSGQDGNYDALNRVAKGTQTVTVWKDSRELGKSAGRIAIALAKGVPSDSIHDGGVFESDGTTVNAVLMEPTAITDANLNLVVDAGWITKGDLCDGVDTVTGPSPCSD